MAIARQGLLRASTAYARVTTTVSELPPRAPRYCAAGCGRRAAPRFSGCLECLSERCSRCGWLAGAHSKWCALHPVGRRKNPADIRCRTCSAPVSHYRLRYCDGCRTQKCYECGRIGGSHKPGCRYPSRGHQPRTVYNTLTLEDVAAFYEREHVRAVAIMAKIVGRVEAEDLLHDMLVRVLRRRPFLYGAVGGYVWTALRFNAPQRPAQRYRGGIPVGDANDLAVVEGHAAEREHGRRIGPPPHRRDVMRYA
jgi:hypothetical protein